jgi:hypothetical protein
VTTNDFPGIDFGSGTGGGTLQDAVTAGGAVTSGVVTIDAANARTNTFGGAVTVLGATVRAGTGNTVGYLSAAFGEGNSVATGGFPGIGHGFGAGWGNTIGINGFGAGYGNTVGSYGFGAGQRGKGGAGSFVFADQSITNYFDRSAQTNEWAMRVQSIYWNIGSQVIDEIESTLTDNTNAIPTSAAVVDYVAAHGGGGTSLVIEASSSIAVVTSGVTRTLSVKTGVYQPADTNLDDLADGSLTGSKVGSGIPAGNITTGNIGVDRLTNAIADTVYDSSDSYRTPYTLTTAGTVTVTRAMGRLGYLKLTGNVTKFTFSATDFPTNCVGEFTLDLYKGAYTFGFDTTKITNSTLLDTTATTKDIPLFFRKPMNESVWRVGQ